MLYKPQLKIYEAPKYTGSATAQPYTVATIPRSTTHLVIDMHDVISYTFTDRKIPDVSELEIQFRDIPQLSNYVPSLTDQKPKNTNPIILAYFENAKLVWFSFIIERERYTSGSESYVRFKGVDFKYFDTTHIVTGTKLEQGEAVISLSRNRTDLLLQELYERTWINPASISKLYGANTSANDTTRTFPGLKSYKANNRRPLSKPFVAAQGYMKDVIEEYITLIGSNIAFRQELRDSTTDEVIDTSTNRCFLHISHNWEKTIDEEVIEQRAQLEETLFSLTDTTNTVYGVATETMIASVKKENRKDWDFTTSEKIEDFSFIVGTNREYLDTPTDTALRKAQQGSVETYVKIMSRHIFSTFNVSDIVRVSGIDYRIQQIQVTRDNGSDTIDIDIQEV